MENDVFISFAFKDEEIAQKIHDYLMNNGVNCFWCKDIPAGGDFGRILGKAILDSKIFLLLLSAASDAESRDSVYQEAMIAHNAKIKKIPVRLEDIMPQNLLYVIAGNLYFDLFNQPLEQALKLLLIDIKKQLSEQVPTESVPSVAKSTNVDSADVIKDDKWHDVELKDLSQWVKDRIKILTDGKVLRGKTFIYRLNKATGQYQKKLKQ
jgi:hypothetical protein